MRHRLAVLLGIGLVVAGIAYAADVSLGTCLDSAAVSNHLTFDLNGDGGVTAQWCGEARTNTGAQCLPKCAPGVQLAGQRRTNALNMLDAGLPEYKASVGM